MAVRVKPRACPSERNAIVMAPDTTAEGKSKDGRRDVTVTSRRRTGLFASAERFEVLHHSHVPVLPRLAHRRPPFALIGTSTALVPDAGVDVGALVDQELDDLDVA